MEQEHLPLIERFLVIGLLNTDINNLTLQSTSSSLPFPSIIPKLKHLPFHILEEYKSNHLKETPSQAAYISNLLNFCFPSGIDIIDHHNNQPPSSPAPISLIPFTLLSGDTRKHITSLIFYENYTMNSLQFSIQKSLCLVSSYELYNTQRDFLMNIYDIIINAKGNGKQRYVYLKDQRQLGRYTVVQESRILEFYISFMLNTLYYPQRRKVDHGDYNSFYVKYCTNNNGRSVFSKYHIESKKDIPTKDFNVACVLDLFDVEALINIYIAMLMEYKIVIVFDNYEEINEVLMALISLIYPLNWKMLPLISYLTKGMIEMLEAPLAVIMGVHESFLPVIHAKIKEGSIMNDTLVYDLTRQCFIMIDMHLPQLPISIMNELRSAICLLIIERKVILSRSSIINSKGNHNTRNSTSNSNGAITFSQTEYSRIFISNRNSKANEEGDPSPLIYFNQKLISIFYRTFIHIIKHINLCIDIELVHKPLVNKNKVQLHDYFDYVKFKSDPRGNDNDQHFLSFMKYFTESMKLTEFLRKYIFKYDKPNKPKYHTVFKLTSLLNHKEKTSIEIKDELSKELRVNMINGICDYYNFTYISLDKAASHYLQVFKELSLSNRLNTSKDDIIWPPIEIYKIMTKQFDYKDYTIPNDDPNDELPYQKCFDNLCNILDTNLEMNIVRSFEKHNSSQSFKEKEYLEDFIKKFNYKSISSTVNTNKSINISPAVNSVLESKSTRNVKAYEGTHTNMTTGIGEGGVSETFHRHTSSQSIEKMGSKQSIMGISKFFCLNGSNKKAEGFKMKLLNKEENIKKRQICKVGIFAQRSHMSLPMKSNDKNSISIKSKSPMLIQSQVSEINHASTLAESTTNVIHTSLFLPHNNSNPVKSNNILCAPVTKKTGLSANNDPHSNSYHISHIQKLEGDNDDFGIFSDGT